MEDNSLKNFDRSIEQKMNEHSVAPPFGAWNRIAAELDAAPVVVTTVTPAPVSHPFFQTGTLLGFVSGALMIGSMVTGWFLYQNYNSATNTTPELLNVSESISNTAEPSLVAPVVVEPKADKQKFSESVTLISATKNKQKKEKTVEVNTVRLSENEVAAPIVKLPVDKQKNTDETYYFPPVDINIPESKLATTEVATNVEEEEDVEADDEAKLVEVKKVANNSSTAKLKFKKKRSAGWNYGKINRTKSRSRY